MDSMNFVYWLQGFFEMTGDVQALTPEQIKMIKDHLGYVFQNQEALKLLQPHPITQPIIQPFISPQPLYPRIPSTWDPVPLNPFVVTCTTSTEKSGS